MLQRILVMMAVTLCFWIGFGGKAFEEQGNIEGVEEGPAPAFIPKPVSEKKIVVRSNVDGLEAKVHILPAVYYHGSGPYRALYSAESFSGIRSSVTLPCHAARFRRDELGYIYLGGWGAGTYGKAVDAGLQKGRITDGNPLHDIYHLILRYEASDTWGVPGPPSLAIACGQTVALTFTADRGMLRLSTGLVNAVSTAGPSPVIVPTRELIEMPVSAGQGWLPNEDHSTNGTIVKRMVSIAQPLCWFGKKKNGTMYPRVIGWNSDNSYFGHEQGSTEPLVRWIHTQVGSYDPQSGNWSWYDIGPGVVQRSDVYPNGGVIVRQEHGHPGDESTAIDLRGSATPPSC